MAQARSATIMDVAKEAGVSFSTVSLALRHPLRVREATRARIDAAAQHLGYERNPTASALASRATKSSKLSRSSMIAYVTEASSDEKAINAEHLDPFCSLLRQECARMGYGFEWLRLEEMRNLATLGRSLHARGCAGVVFGRVSDSLIADKVDWQHFSLVRCNNSLAHLDVHRVESDVFDAAWRVTNEVLTRGYRNLGLSLYRHGRGFDDDVRRAGAFRSAIEEWGDSSVKANQVFSHDGKWNRDKFLRWFEQNELDALVCFGVVEYYWMLEVGIRIPEDIAIAVLTGGGEKDIRVTGCRENYERITLSAFRMCDQSIRAREYGRTESPVALNVPCLWNEGTSLPSLAKCEVQ